MESKKLEALLMAVDLGSFTKAAEVMGYTQSGLTHMMNSLEREVSTEYIGELVMDKLRAVDEVAYVRFASVYRQFKDIDTFMKELNKLLEGK